jgi:iron(III) transport system substrate-binding protein
MLPRRLSISRRDISVSAGIGLLGMGLFGARARAAGATTLTLYSAQHQQAVDMIISAFTKDTGIKVRTHHGEAPEIAAQIIREGAHSPADVYFTENSPELVLLAEKGLLSPIDPKTLALVPAKYSGPDGDWIGVLARENVLAFNPKMIKEADLPTSLLDLGKPAWKGKVAIAPSDADFLPLVKAVAETSGKPAALAWLKGLKANAQVFDDDEGVVAAVERGAIATGVINNYYWARLRTEQGADKTVSQIHHFSNGDVGGLINVSGAGILKSSKNQAAAQTFVAFLISKPTQTMLASSDVDFEYPLASGVAPNPLLKPFDELRPPALTMAQLGDDRESAQLLRQAGLL